jgi:hypothetical protein
MLIEGTPFLADTVRIYALPKIMIEPRGAMVRSHHATSMLKLVP